MEKVKYIAAAAGLSALLMLGSPALTSADAEIQMPPAVGFVQDENERMLVYHNFEGDNGLLIPWDTNVDEGIWTEP